MLQPNCSETVYRIKEKDLPPDKKKILEKIIEEMVPHCFSPTDTNFSRPGELCLYFYQDDIPDVATFLEYFKIPYQMREWLAFSYNFDLENYLEEKFGEKLNFFEALEANEDKEGFRDLGFGMRVLKERLKSDEFTDKERKEILREAEEYIAKRFEDFKKRYNLKE